MFLYTRNLLIGLLNCSKYKEGQVLYIFETGTYYPNIEQEGVYELELISGGASGFHWDTGSAIHGYYQGGTGAYYRGEVYLYKGVHTAVIGSGGSGSPLAVSNGGGNTYLTYSSTTIQLSGGNNNGSTLINNSNEVRRISYNPGFGLIMAAAGKNLYTAVGNKIAPVPANLTAYGQGGGAYCNGITASGYSGTGGYMKITYLRRR